MKLTSIINMVGRLKKASDELKKKVHAFLASEGDEYGDDREVVLEAMKTNPLKFEYAYNFFGDKEVMLTAIRGAKNISPSPFSMVEESLTDDTEFVREAVMLNPSALEYASARLRGDKDFVLPVLRKSSWVVRYLSLELRDDPDIGMLVADKVLYTDNHKPLKYLSERLQLFYGSRYVTVDGMSVEFLDFYTDSEREVLIKGLKKGFAYIRASKIPKFSKALMRNLTVYFGKMETLSKAYPTEGNEIGFYSRSKYAVCFNTDRVTAKNLPLVVVHEFAHALHNLLIVGGFENQAIKDLYEHATMDRTHCQLASLPNLGSPLSNILSGGFWQWSVRKAYEDYYLKQIFEHYYIYRNRHNQEKVFTKQQILKMITCPSEYAGKNEKEFFAEMAVLITIGAVKPSQKVVAYKFISLVQDNVK